MKMIEESPACTHCGFDGKPNAVHQLPMGVILKERFLIGRVLGQGGFGITYMGWDGDRENPVAIKEFFPGGFVHRQSAASMDVVCYSGNAAEVFDRNKKRFVKEANTLHQMKGLAEIVQVIDYFEENNTAYIVMEYVDGITLKDYLKQVKRRLSPQEVTDLLRPLLAALGEVHDLHLIHRDISPDNIMLTRSGGIKLIDFGTVRYMDDNDLSKSTEAILKPGFAPMEQYQNRGKIGPWTDIYAICATMYYCMTGKLPMDAPSRVVDDTDIILQEVIPDVDEKIALALRLGMANRISKRLQNVGELYRILYGNGEVETAKKAAEKEQPQEPRQPEVTAAQQPPKVNTSSGNTNRQASVKPAGSNRETVKKQQTPPVSAPVTNRKKKSWLVLIAAAALLIGIFAMRTNDRGESIWETLAETAFSTVAREGWVTEGEYSYYYQDNALVRGWFVADGSRYYADEEGRVAFNRSVPIGSDTYFFNGAGQIQRICVARIVTSWSEKPFYFENARGEIRDVFYRELAEPMENCTGFTFSVKVNQVESGSADGVWKICLRINGQWERISAVDVINHNGTVTVQLEEPVSFDAFTAYGDTPGYFKGDCNYEMTDIMTSYEG